MSIKDKTGINKLNSKLKKIVSEIDTAQSVTLISRSRHRALLKKNAQIDFMIISKSLNQMK